jgi:hypothetical protein
MATRIIQESTSGIRAMTGSRKIKSQQPTERRRPCPAHRPIPAHWPHEQRYRSVSDGRSGEKPSEWRHRSMKREAKILIWFGLHRLMSRASCSSGTRGQPTFWTASKVMWPFAITECSICTRALRMNATVLVVLLGTSLEMILIYSAIYRVSGGGLITISKLIE